MKGKELQKIINSSGVSIAELVLKTEIKERTFYSLYNKKEVEQHYLDKITAAGIDLQKTAKNNTGSNQDESNYLKAELIWRKQNEQDLREIIKDLRINNTGLLESNQTLNRLVNSQLDKFK